MRSLWKWAHFLLRRFYHWLFSLLQCLWLHYNDVIMSAMASQIASLTILYSTVYTGADQRKHQSSMSLAFVQGIQWWPVNSPHKGPVSWKMFPFDEAIMVNADFCGQSQFELTFPNQSYIVKSPFVKQFNWLKKWACKLLVEGNMKSELAFKVSWHLSERVPWPE